MLGHLGAMLRHLGDKMRPKSAKMSPRWRPRAPRGANKSEKTKKPKSAGLRPGPIGCSCYASRGFLFIKFIKKNNISIRGNTEDHNMIRDEVFFSLPTPLRTSSALGSASRHPPAPWASRLRSCPLRIHQEPANECRASKFPFRIL